MGVFSGASKPKPFQKKRASLTVILALTLAPSLILSPMLSLTLSLTLNTGRREAWQERYSSLTGLVVPCCVTLSCLVSSRILSCLVYVVFRLVWSGFIVWTYLACILSLYST
jgi:hypothetical protein